MSEEDVKIGLKQIIGQMTNDWVFSRVATAIAERMS
jgi:hypothetical protein